MCNKKKINHFFLCLNKATDWIDKNGIEGYDPYDIRALYNKSWIQNNFLLRKFLNFLSEYFPSTTRRIFQVKPSINAKGVGLLAQSYINLYEIESNEEWISKSRDCLEWLLSNPSKIYNNLCWGYPFDWQTRIFIPKGTPSAVVTAIVIDALLLGYKIINEEKYLLAAESACNFIYNELNWHQFDETMGCFSYTPLDKFHVHNANMLAASALIKFSQIKYNADFVKRARMAVAYTLSNQNSNGSWYYWGPPDQIPGIIDGYHTGFILRSLYEITKYFDDTIMKNKLEKGIEFYLNNLFTTSNIPKDRHNRLYPLNIHTFSEAILNLTVLSNKNTRYNVKAYEIVEMSIDLFQDKKDGYFYYRIHKYWKSKFPFIRWSQSWMVFALSSFLLNQKKNYVGRI
ncbi:hypothetical protein JXQ31_09215 [candidate division KSB1 bacterium]|nr:hypothetical protein [candidate division KSB1 bacterium]